MAEESPGEAPLRILVVDDHAITREAVADMARDAGHEVYEAYSGEHAVQMASSVRPDLIIMDVLLPGMSGIEATERVVARDARTQVLMLSAADSADTVRAAMKAGATGYLTKAAASRATLLDALRRTAAGERVFAPPTLMDALVHDPGLARSEKAQLTVREKEIVTLAAQGAASSDIAGALGLSPRTVDNHLLRVYRKLGIAGRTQLVRIAIDQQPNRYPWAGQACTIMLADIASFAAPDRSARDHLTLREALYEILREAFMSSGIPWSASQMMDRGDGVLLVVPPGVPTSAVIDPCLMAMASGLRRHNSAVTGAVSMQLRVAVAAGPVTTDAMGVSGEAIILASRLVDAPPFQEESRASGADLGVIVSQSVYQTVIAPGTLSLHPADLHSVNIGVKELETIAWAWFSEPARPPGPRGTDGMKGRLGPQRHRMRSPSVVSRTRALYGRDDALRLARDFLTHAEGDPRANRRPDPVLLFEGPRGTGKTALLTALAEQLDQQVPYASLDCEEFEGDTRTLLALLALDLSRHGGRRSTLRFPRLVTAQIAISAPLETAIGSGKARDEIQRRLELYQRSSTELREMVTSGLIAALESAPAWSNARPAVTDAVAGQGARLILGGHLSTPRGRRILLREGQSWYGHQDQGLTRHPLDVLADLNRMAARPSAEGGRAVAELLWAAFLADLRNSGPKNQPVHCLLLLDNAEAAAGGHLLDGLLAARRPSSTGEPDPITVIATSRGGLSMRMHAAERAELTDASYEDYLRRGQHRRVHPLYPVALPGLTPDETELMVAALDLPGSNRRAVADLVYRITAGHPGVTRILLDAIAEHPDRSTDLPALLTEPAVGHLSVEESMLSQFLVGIPPGTIEDLVTCSAARHREAARHLAARSNLLIYASGPYAAPFSEDLWWQETPDGQAELPPVLRRLLLRRLSRRDNTAPANWNRVCDTLADQCKVAGDDVGTMYYALAVGNIQHVVSQLTESLHHLDASEWLLLLERVAAAPNRLDHRQPVYQQLSALTEWADPGEQPLASVARIVAAAWICSDPLSAGHRRELYQRMADDLQIIAIHHPKGNHTAFHSAINQYTGLAASSTEAAVDRD